MKFTTCETKDLIGFKVKIYPNQDQKDQINKQINLARAVYNIGLDMQNKAYDNGEGYIKLYDMMARFAKMRNEDPDYAWLKDMSVGTMRIVLKNLDNAFSNFFGSCKEENPQMDFGYPKFKSKKRSKKSFPVRPERTHAYGNKILISGIKDQLVLAKDHHIPEKCRLYDTYITFDGYDYWFSGSYIDHDRTHIDMSDREQTDAIGIDVGVVNMITTSNGDFYKLPDTSKEEKRLKRQQRHLDKDYRKYLGISMSTKTKYYDVPKSKNHQKRLAAQHKTMAKIYNKRRTAIHTATKQIVEQYPSAIVIENISVKEQLQTQPWMRKYAPQMMFNTIHNQIKYKAANRGIPVIIAEPNFASTLTCSNCGARGYTRHRKFTCSKCGFTADRDLNAAYNLRNLAR